MRGDIPRGQAKRESTHRVLKHLTKRHTVQSPSIITSIDSSYDSLRPGCLVVGCAEIRRTLMMIMMIFKLFFSLSARKKKKEWDVLQNK